MLTVLTDENTIIMLTRSTSLFESQNSHQRANSHQHRNLIPAWQSERGQWRKSDIRGEPITTEPDGINGSLAKSYQQVDVIHGPSSCSHTFMFSVHTCAGE